jgi:large conductance mechanosensitive channel
MLRAADRIPLAALCWRWLDRPLVAALHIAPHRDQDGPHPRTRRRPMLREFREFAMRGNVVDMAVGIVIGAAFTSIVQSLVNDILMPPLGVLLGGVDFSDTYLQLTLRDRSFPTLQAAREAGAAVIAIGSFITAVVRFVIVAFALFLVVRQVNRLRRMFEEPQAAAAEAPPPPELKLLAEIRDLLKAGVPRS